MANAKRVLIVDDNEANLLTLCAVLEDEGYEVVEATTYARAEELLETSHFDVVLLDRGLGQRDGAALAPVAKARNTALVCVLSGHVTDESLPGVDAQIRKGDPVEGLLKRLDGV